MRPLEVIVRVLLECPACNRGGRLEAPTLEGNQLVFRCDCGMGRVYVEGFVVKT